MSERGPSGATPPRDDVAAMDLARRLWHRQCGLDGSPCPTASDCDSFNLGFKAALLYLATETPSERGTPTPEITPHCIPMAWIEHHKGGDNLVWDKPGGRCTPLYVHSAPSWATSSASARTCEWREDDDGIWHTGCGQAWVYTDAGTPKDHGALFCYHCGGTMKTEHRATDRRTG